jgi:hypothetical protein
MENWGDMTRGKLSETRMTARGITCSSNSSSRALPSASASRGSAVRTTESPKLHAAVASAARATLAGIPLEKCSIACRDSCDHCREPLHSCPEPEALGADRAKDLKPRSQWKALGSGTAEFFLRSQSPWDGAEILSSPGHRVIAFFKFGG